MPYEPPENSGHQAQPKKGAEADRILDELAEAQIQDESRSPDAPNAPTEPSDLSKSIDDLKNLFATIVPQDTVEFTDRYGGRHTARALLAARQQVRVMRELEALFEANVDLSLLSGGSEIDDIMRAVIAVAADERVLTGLGRAFAEAHPKAMRQALALAKECGDEFPVDTVDGADLFPVEEIVAALVPFFVRLAMRLLDALGQMPGQGVQAPTK